jgi:hypothetical protein
MPAPRRIAPNASIGGEFMTSKKQYGSRYGDKYPYRTNSDAGQFSVINIL